ncbi:tetratricopeptide repeat protein [Novosphingobium sp.]|uniref:tetratricopeptide repeat protein n=1 Tax=Novosphingobium sp. TaxID=1874826 RepID=UPI003B51887C
MSARQSPDAGASVDQLLEAGLAHHRAGDLAGAARCYQRALERAPGLARGWHLLGLTHAQAGEAADAMALITRALAIDPGDAEAHGDLGHLHQRQGRPAEAAASYRAALAADPAGDAAWRTRIWTDLGMALSATGDRENAIMAWQTALEIDAGRIDTQYHLASALHDSGALDDAAAGYRTVLAAQPRHRDAQARLKQAMVQMGAQPGG